MAVPGPIEVAGDVMAAASTLAGLILVFLAATTALYESYGAAFQTPNVRKKFRWRARFIFAGFTFSLLAAFFALLGKWQNCEWAAELAIWLFMVALVWVLIAALRSVLETGRD